MDKLRKQYQHVMVQQSDLISASQTARRRRLIGRQCRLELFVAVDGDRLFLFHEIHDWPQQLSAKRCFQITFRRAKSGLGIFNDD